jgi:hypothetical protein
MTHGKVEGVRSAGNWVVVHAVEEIAAGQGVLDVTLAVLLVDGCEGVCDTFVTMMDDWIS